MTSALIAVLQKPINLHDCQYPVMHQRLIVIASALLLIADLVFSENAFIDSAPEGYYDRKSLAGNVWTAGLSLKINKKR